MGTGGSERLHYNYNRKNPMSIYQDIENLIESLEFTDSTHEVDSFARDTARRLREILVEHPDPHPDGSRMVRIEGHQLETVLNEIQERLKHGKIYLLRVDQRGDQVAFKFNEGSWSPGLGTHQPPY